MIAERIQITGRAVLGMVSDETDEFGIDAGALRVLKGCEVFADQLPACEVFGRVVTAYVLQIAGLRGSAGKIERSFGGDMVHALYLPHVDLWRGDRRFAQLVKEAAPRFGDRVISTINELPHAIDTWRELR